MLAPINPETMRLAYERDGFAVVRGFLGPSEVARLATAFDAVYADAMRHGRSYRHGNLYYRVHNDEQLGPVMRIAQWPSAHVPVLEDYRRDPRVLALVAPFIGTDLKQIINQLHWKPPGAAMGEFAWHQDCRFRKPVEAYRNLASSYVQVGIAIDRHDAASGCMRMIPGSHRRGDLDLGDERPVLDTALDDASLCAAGLDPADAVLLELAPGDLAFWSPYLVHGSGCNTADHARRLYINGYVRAADCDRGEWAFRNGVPVPLGAEPSLVHYEQLFERPEPHYPEA